MEPNTILSIAVPTFNRAELLDQFLQIHVPLAKALNISIHISDNASTDSTRSIVAKHKTNYELIQYYRNEFNIGDKNFETVMNYPDTDYVWLMGDTYQIPIGGLESVLDLLVKNHTIYDAVVLNLLNRIIDVDTQDFTDGNLLLHSVGSVMSCISCLVYSKNLISNSNFSRFRNSNYTQTGVIFESISWRPFNIRWEKEISIQCILNPNSNKSAWSLSPHVFEVVCNNWVNSIFSLPVYYTLENKYKCIKDLSRVSGIFSFRHLLVIRSTGIFNFNIYKQYIDQLNLTSTCSKNIILLISVTPRFALHLVITAYRHLRPRKLNISVL